MRTRNLIMSAITILLVWPTISMASIAPLPQLLVSPHWTTMDGLGYQGYATTSSGSPVADGAHSFVFSLFEHPTDPTPMLWTETQTLTTTSGRFSANLGETVPIPIDVFGTPDGDTLRTLWLQVELDTEPILPRTLLTAVPTARVSERVLGDIETELMAMRLRSPSGHIPFEIRSTDSGTTTFQVDSFFDITYRIEWVSHPYEALVGLYGTGNTTQGSVEIKAADSAAEVSLGIEHEDIGARMHTADDGSGSFLHLWNDPLATGDSALFFASADDGGSRLTISNIGSSGEDGVRAAAVPGDAEITLKLGAQATEAHLFTSDDGSGSGLHLFDTPGTDSVDIGLRASSGGGHLTVSNIGSSGLDGVRIDLEENLGQITFVRQPLSQPIDSPLVILTTPTLSGHFIVDSFFDVDLRMIRSVSSAGTLDEQTSRDLSGFGGTVSSSTSASGGRLTVSNIGSSGEDGVRIDVGAVNPPSLLIFDTTGGTHSLHRSSDLIFVEPLTNDSGIFARDKMKLKDLQSGGVIREVEITPIELVSLNLNSSGDEHVIRVHGGSGAGGRISLEEKPAGATVPIEIVALSLVSSEPIMVTRPHGASPTSVWAMSMDYDASDRLIQTFRPPSGSSLDSIRLHGEGLEMDGPTHRYVYDSFGMRYVSVSGGVQSAVISPNGDVQMAGNSLLATEPTSVCGIGSLDPAYKLFVDGDFCATGVTCPSDIRLKENIETIGSATELIGQLRGVSFDWKRDQFPDRNLSEEHQIGFIAQEVAAVLPEVVKTSSDGFLGVDYAKITPVLVQAVNEQQKKIDQQNSTIAQMQSKLERLERLVEQMASERGADKNLKYAVTR